MTKAKRKLTPSQRLAKIAKIVESQIAKPYDAWSLQCPYMNEIYALAKAPKRK